VKTLSLNGSTSYFLEACGTSTTIFLVRELWPLIGGTTYVGTTTLRTCKSATTYSTFGKKQHKPLTKNWQKNHKKTKQSQL